MEHDHRIFIKVSNVYATPSFNNFRTLLTAQPAHVRVEQAALCVVRIRVRVCVLVVSTVVTSPFEDAVLQVKKKILKYYIDPFYFYFYGFH